MSNRSPGLHSNKAFSIGSETADDVDKNNPRGNPLLSSCSEETPLILPLPESDKLFSIEDNHHLVVDVFNINENDGSWRQGSRFARYEEDCEGFDNHFGKAHVPFIQMNAYHALQTVTAKSVLIPDITYSGFDDFCITLEKILIEPDVPTLGRTIADLLRDRVFSLEKLKPIGRAHSSSTQSLNHASSGGSIPAGLPRSLLSAPNNLASLGVTPQKRLPTAVSGLRFKGSFLGNQNPSSYPLEPVIWDEANEVSMLVTGVVPEINVCRLVMMRFTVPIEMQQVFPKMNNIRHLFFLIGPQLEDMEYLDMGRALATVVSNPNFTEIFDKLKSPESINRAIERFLSDTVVIPPGRIDNKNLVAGDLIRKLVNMQAEKTAHTSTQKHVHPANLDIEKNAPKSSKEKEEKPPGCFLFSGVIDDLKNRSKHYFDDWTSGMTFGIFTTVIYMFCVTVVPTLTFGAILSYGTNGILAVKECLIAQAICGAFWSFFSCQPLLVISPTGPFLVFEKALYQFTESNQLDFLEVRLYTGIFLLLIAIFGSAFNIARLIRYVTIYTEDIFCALISLIFFFEVYEFLEHQQHHHPIRSIDYYMNNTMNASEENIPIGLSRPNTFLLECIMVVVSIFIFHYLRQLSRSSFLGRSFRNFCGNFGGSFAVVVVTAMYHSFFKNVEVSMVAIPEDYGNARKYGLFVMPTHLPSAHTLIVSAIAAPLLFVLLFVETEIPQQMALRESRKLKKGGGLHWDLIIAGLCTVICSVLGLPWQCPAAVQSLAHITALTVYKKSAPGQPSQPSHVLEQRMSGLATYCALGIFSIVGHYIAMPSAAIFGVFFYLGIRNLNGNQLLMRIKMFFLPAKYRGNHKFLDIAPFYVTGFYTFIQSSLVVLMFAAKSTQIGGLCFPLMLVACSVFVDKFLPLIFTKDILEALDGEDTEEEEVNNDNEENPVDFYYNTRIPV